MVTHYLSAIHYVAGEACRCSAARHGALLAALPQSPDEDKYSSRRGRCLAVGRYYLGLPFYRLQGYQAMLGVPVPDYNAVGPRWRRWRL